MSRVIRWGEESDSSDDDEIPPPSMIQSRLIAKQESSDHKLQENQQQDSYRGGYGTKLGYEGHDHRQRSAMDHRRDGSNSFNNGDYRQQQQDRRGTNHSNYKSHLNVDRGKGGNRHVNNHHHHQYRNEPTPSRDWKEQARQSTLEKYASVPSKHITSDGSSWMEQRILKQKQREKEENEMKEKLQREREEEKKRKKLGQIEALKAALLMKQEDEPPKPEIKILLKPDRKVVQDEHKAGVKTSNASEKMMPSSRAKKSTDAVTTSTTSSSPPVSSLAKLSMESSAPSSSLPPTSAATSPSSSNTTTRPKLKLAPRTKPVPKPGTVERDKKANTEDIQHDKDIEQRSSLALAVESNKKDSVQVSNKWKSSKDTKSHSEKERESSTSEARNECDDDESRTSERSSSDAPSRGNTRGGHGRGGPGRRGNGRGSKRLHGRGRGGRHHEIRGESTSEKGNGGGDGVHPNDSPKTDFNSEATSTSSKPKQSHKWETQTDGSVVLSRVRKDSVSSDRGDTGPIGGRGRGRGNQKGRGRGRGRGRGSGPSSDSHF